MTITTQFLKGVVSNEAYSSAFREKGCVFWREFKQQSFFYTERACLLWCVVYFSSNWVTKSKYHSVNQINVLFGQTNATCLDMTLSSKMPSMIDKNKKTFLHSIFSITWKCRVNFKFTRSVRKSFLGKDNWQQKIAQIKESFNPRFELSATIAGDERARRLILLWSAQTSVPRLNERTMGMRFKQRPLTVTFNDNLNLPSTHWRVGNDVWTRYRKGNILILNCQFQFKRDSSSFHRVFLRATLEAFWLYLVRKIGNYSVPSLEGH